MESALVDIELLVGLGGVDFDDIRCGGAGCVQGHNVDGGCGPRLVGLGDGKLYMPDRWRSSGPGSAEHGLFIAVGVR